MALPETRGIINTYQSSVDSCHGWTVQDHIDNARRIIAQEKRMTGLGGDTIYSGEWVRVERDWSKHPRFVYEIKVYTSSHYPEGCFEEDFDDQTAEQLREELAEAISVLNQTREKPEEE